MSTSSIQYFNTIETDFDPRNVIFFKTTINVCKDLKLVWPKTTLYSKRVPMQVYSCRMRLEQDSNIKRQTHIVLDDGTLLYTTENLEGQLSGKTWSYRTGIMTMKGKAVTVAVLTQDTYQNRMSRAFKAKMVGDADKSVSPVGFLPFRQQKISRATTCEHGQQDNAGKTGFDRSARK